MRNQQTIRRMVTCSGVGLHTGYPVNLTLRPAPPNTGIVFIRTDDGKPVALSASARNLIPTELCTTISTNGMAVKTVEHVLSALVGLGIDNAFIELDAGEVPVMDGSAAPFVRLIKAAGLELQNARRSFLKIMQPIELIDGNKKIRLEPASHTRITYSIQYEHPLIKRQTYVYHWSVSAFERDIAAARTFGFFNEVQHLWSKGLGKGGSLDNTIILSDEGLLNESGLRFHDEFVRHKILDLIGDLALLGVPFIGHLIADRAGHALHTQFVQKILDQPEKWILVSTESKPPYPPSKSSPVYTHLQVSSC